MCKDKTINDTSGDSDRCSAVSVETLVRCKEVLEEMLERNRLRHDLDAYLYDLTEWGLGRETVRPDPKVYGL